MSTTKPHKQTRRTIGLSRATYERIAAYSERHDIPMSQIVEQAIAPVIHGDTVVDREGCKACEVMQRIRGYPCVRHNEPADRAERAKAIGSHAVSAGREWRKLVDQVARQYGCEVVLTGSGHLMLEHPSGWSVLTGSTPGSQWKAMKKLRSQTRKAARLGASGSERSPAPSCALCARLINGEARAAPLGKEDAIVKICVACDDERMAVRKGRVA